jgi:hypothetical protein
MICACIPKQTPRNRLRRAAGVAPWGAEHGREQSGGLFSPARAAGRFGGV